MRNEGGILAGKMKRVQGARIALESMRHYVYTLREDFSNANKLRHATLALQQDIELLEYYKGQNGLFWSGGRLVGARADEAIANAKQRLKALSIDAVAKAERW